MLQLFSIAVCATAALTSAAPAVGVPVDASARPALDALRASHQGALLLRVALRGATGDVIESHRGVCAGADSRWRAIVSAAPVSRAHRDVHGVCMRVP
jgi:hypothetical protein